MGKIWHEYRIREVDNGFILSIEEELLSPTLTGDESYFDSLSRLITHLTSKINLIEKEGKNGLERNQDAE